MPALFLRGDRQSDDQMLTRPRHIGTPDAPSAGDVFPMFLQFSTRGEFHSFLLANRRATGHSSVFLWWENGVTCCFPSDKEATKLNCNCEIPFRCKGLAKPT